MINDQYYKQKEPKLTPILSVESKDSNISFISSNQSNAENFHIQSDQMQKNIQNAQLFQKNDNNSNSNNDNQCRFNVVGLQKMQEGYLKKQITEVLTKSKNKAKSFDITYNSTSSYVYNSNSTALTNQTLPSARLSARELTNSNNTNNVIKNSKDPIFKSRLGSKQSQMDSIKSQIKEIFIKNMNNSKLKKNINSSKALTSRHQTPLLTKIQHDYDLFGNYENPWTQRFRCEKSRTTPSKQYYGNNTSRYQYQLKENNKKQHDYKPPLIYSLKERIKLRLGYLDEKAQKCYLNQKNTEKNINPSSNGFKNPLDTLKLQPMFEKKLSGSPNVIQIKEKIESSYDF